MSWSWRIPLTHTFQRLSIVVAKGQALKLRELQTLQALVELCPKGQALQVLWQTLQALVETWGEAPRPQTIHMNIYSKHEPPGIYYRFLFIHSYPPFCFGVHKKQWLWATAPFPRVKLCKVLGNFSCFKTLEPLPPRVKLRRLLGKFLGLVILQRGTRHVV